MTSREHLVTDDTESGGQKVISGYCVLCNRRLYLGEHDTLRCPVCSSPILPVPELGGRIETSPKALPLSPDGIDPQNNAAFVGLFLNALLENLEDAVVVCDEYGVLTMFNQAGRKLHGLPETPIPAERWASHYDLYKANGVTLMPLEEVPLFRALRDEVVSDVEMVVAPRGLPPRTLLASGKALRGPDGKRLGAMVVMRDITEIRRAEEYSLHNLQFRIRQEQAMQVNDTVTQALVVARSAFEAGQQAKGMAALLRGLEASEEIVRRQMAELEKIGPVTPDGFTREGAPQVLKTENPSDP